MKKTSFLPASLPKRNKKEALPSPTSDKIGPTSDEHQPTSAWLATFTLLSPTRTCANENIYS